MDKAAIHQPKSRLDLWRATDLSEHPKEAERVPESAPAFVDQKMKLEQRIAEPMPSKRARTLPHAQMF